MGDDGDKVVYLDNQTTEDIPVDRVLNAAIGEIPDIGIVLGWDTDGELYFASSTSAAGEILILLEKAKQDILGRV